MDGAFVRQVAGKARKLETSTVPQRMRAFLDEHEQLPGDVHSTLTKVCGAIEDSLSAGHFAAAAPAAAQTPDAPAAAATPSKADKKAKRRRDGDAAARRNGAQPAEAAAGGAPAEQNTAKRKRSEAALHMDSQPGAEPAEAERGGSPDPVKRKKKKKKEKKHGHIQDGQGPEVTEPQATAAAAADGASIPAAVRDNGAVEAVQRKKKKRKHREAEPD